MTSKAPQTPPEQLTYANLLFYGSWGAIAILLITFAVYVISGLCTAWAGIILTADVHTSDPVSVALFSELDAILAVVIGGGSLMGGRIYLGMTILGALIIQALTTSILMSGLPPEYNLLVKAVVVLFVLLLQSNNFRNAVVKLFRRRKA